MGNKNTANRQCAEVDIRILSTMAPFLYFDGANVTGFNISSDDTYAKSMGVNKIAFSNPVDASGSIEAQVVPFKLYAMLSDGTIESTATYAEKKTVTCATAGTLTVPKGIKTGTLFVYKAGEYAETPIAGTFTDTTFTATQAKDIEVGSSYDIGYLVTKTTGVNKVSFNSKKNPPDLYVTYLTNDKNEDGVLVPKKVTLFKAKPKKNLEISFSSDGDPVSVKLEMTALEDKNGNQVEMVEVTDED